MKKGWSASAKQFSTFSTSSSSSTSAVTSSSRFHSEINLRFPSYTHLSAIDSKQKLLQSYRVNPPIKPWPRNLHPKLLIFLISSHQNVDLALQIFHHAGLFHPGFSHTFSTYSAMILKLSRSRSFSQLETLISGLLHSRIDCDENLFIRVIRGYGIAGLPLPALRTFLRIKRFRIKPTVRSFNTLLNALVQNRRYDLVHLLFKNSNRKFTIAPNLVTCNILVKALCKKGDLEVAVSILEEMPSMGLIPNIVSYTTVLDGFVSIGDMLRAKEIFRFILDSGWIPDAVTYTVLVHGLCKQGKVMQAVKVMDEMEENHVQPNEVTYSVVIEACCKEKNEGKAVCLLEDMLGKKYIPNSSLCCKIIDVMCERGGVEGAYRLWKKLLGRNCTPDSAILSTLIHWFCKEGNIWEAKKVFREFESVSIPSVLTYTTLISGMCERGELVEAGSIWDDMVDKGWDPNVVAYNVLIKGLCNIGRLKEGIGVFDEMLRKNCAPNAMTFSIILDAFGECTHDEEEFKSFLHIVTSSSLISIGCWTLIVTRVLGCLHFDMLSLDKILDDV